MIKYSWPSCLSIQRQQQQQYSKVQYYASDMKLFIIMHEHGKKIRESVNCMGWQAALPQSTVSPPRHASQMELNAHFYQPVMLRCRSLAWGCKSDRDLRIKLIDSVCLSVYVVWCVFLFKSFVDCTLFDGCGVKLMQMAVVAAHQIYAIRIRFEMHLNGLIADFDTMKVTNYGGGHVIQFDQFVSIKPF